MTNSVATFLRDLPANPYIVQFVLSLNVEGNSQSAVQITTYLIPTSSKQAAKESALQMVESLSESYRNSNGEPVTVKCVGLHSIEEADYVDDDGRIPLGVVQFSNTTSPNNLLQEHSHRNDLPLLD